MLIFDFYAIGNKLLSIRKKNGMTQAEVAEVAGLSDRTYADIERGTVNMRIETLLNICRALHITPDDILTKESAEAPDLDTVFSMLTKCTPHQRQTAIKLLSVYLDSLNTPNI